MCTSKMLIKPFLCFLLAIVASSAALAATYVYSGPPYTSVGGTYNTGMRISGVFTTATPIPPNLSNTEIGVGGLRLVTSWSFSDGVTTFTNGDSSIYANDYSLIPSGTGADFVVSTDAAGNITAFSIGLEKPRSVGLPPIFVDAFRVATAPVLYRATSQSPCLSYIVIILSGCAGFNDPGPNFGSAQTAGSFSTSTVQAIPALAPGSVLLLLGLMAIAAGFYLRRKPD